MRPEGKPSWRFIDRGMPLLLLVSLVVFLDSIGYGVVVPVLPEYADMFKIGDFELGLLFAVYALALLVTAVPMGILSDRWGRKPFVLFGMFAMAGAYVFYAYAEGYWMLVVARFLDGLTAAATWSAGLALIGDRFDEDNLGRNFGYAMSAAAVGAIAGPLLGGIMAEQVGYRSPFLLVAAFCLVGGVLSVFLTPSKKGERTGHVGSVLKEMLLPVARNRTILLACGATAVTTIGFGLLEPMLPLYLEDTFRMTSMGIGFVFGVTTACYGIMSPVAGKISDRAGRRLPMVIGLVSTAAVAPFIVVAKQVWLVYVLMGVLGGALAFFGTPSLPLVTDALREGCGNDGQGNLFGTSFGLVNLFWSAGYAIGPIIGGALVSSAGLFWAAVAYSILVALLIPFVLVVLRGR